MRQRPGAGLASHRRQPFRIAQQLLQRVRPRLRRRRRARPARSCPRPRTARCRCPPRPPAAGPSWRPRARRSTAPRSPPAGRRDRPTRRRAPAWPDPARPGSVARSPSSVMHGVAIGSLARAAEGADPRPSSFSRRIACASTSTFLIGSRRPTEITTWRSGGIPRVAASHCRSRRPGSNSSRSIPRRSSPTRAVPSSAASRAAIVGPRGEHERAAAVVLVEHALHARLGGARPRRSDRAAAATALPPGQALDGDRGEHARVVGRGGVDRVGERDAVPARDARRGARRRERAVGGVDDVVAAQPRRQQRVVGRQIGVVGDVRQERQAGAAEQRPVDLVADVGAERVRRRARRRGSGRSDRSGRPLAWDAAAPRPAAPRS